MTSVVTEVGDPFASEVVGVTADVGAGRSVAPARAPPAPRRRGGAPPPPPPPTTGTGAGGAGGTPTSAGGAAGTGGSTGGGGMTTTDFDAGGERPVRVKVPESPMRPTHTHSFNF